MAQVITKYRFFQVNGNEVLERPTKYLGWRGNHIKYEDVNSMDEATELLALNNDYGEYVILPVIQLQ